MKILKVLNNTKIILVDLEVNIGENKQNALTLCVEYKGKIIPLRLAHDGRPTLMKEENSTEI